MKPIAQIRKEFVQISDNLVIFNKYQLIMSQISCPKWIKATTFVNE